MDEVQLAYMLIDDWQRRKPLGVEQFETNAPRTAVDRSVEILTGNPVRWHIMYDREQKAERDLIRRLELFGTGLFEDINQLLTDRYEMQAEVQAAWYALVRGWIVSELTLSEDSGRDDSPVWFNLWDPRYVYPRRSTNGLRDVVYSLDVTLEELMEDYPDAEVRLDDPEASVSKHIWYDGQFYAVAADYRPKGLRGQFDVERATTMLFSTKHGLSKIPIQIVPADGVAVRSVVQYPSLGAWTDATNTSGTRRGQEQYTDARSWTANQGRSILDSGLRTITQYNDFMAALLQAVKLYGLPTVNAYSKDGTFGSNVSIGQGIVNRMSIQRQEELRFERPSSAPPGIENVLGALARENNVALLPPALLDDVPASSGFERAQRINVAMTRLGPWGRCLDRWQEQVFQSGVSQMRESEIPLTFAGRYPQSNTYFEMTFEPDEVQRKYRVRAERTPLLPDDLMQRAQLAEILLNPARPMASLRTVWDRVLNFEDPEGEEDRIYADQAMHHPAVISRRMEKALIEEGLYEYLDIARDENVIAALAQQYKMGQAAMAARSIQAPPGTAGALGGTDVRPEASPPEMGNPMSESGRGPGAQPMLPGL